MLAGDGFGAWAAVHWERRGMQEALIDTCDPEGQEILFRLPAVIHQGVRVGRPVGVVDFNPLYITATLS
jgi:hypothetical protein